MSFKDGTFAQRYQKLGDEAETAFEKSWPGPYERYGINRPKVDVRKLDKFITYTPDYLAQYHPDGPACLIEVQGCGKDQTYQFKLDKLETLGKWGSHQGVTFWLWDNVSQTGIWVSYAAIRMMIYAGKAVKKTFPEGKAYWELSVADVREFADTEALIERYGPT